MLRISARLLLSWNMELDAWNKIGPLSIKREISFFGEFSKQKRKGVFYLPLKRCVKIATINL